jgi:predicted transcriptional regulator
MDTPLDDAEFLIRSVNRVTVLRLLAEEPRDRRDVQETLAVSRVTMGRLLGDLEDHGWVERRGHEYHIISLGRMVIEDVDAFLETVATAQQLRDVIGYLPVEDIPFDLRRFGDTEFIRVSRSDSDAPIRRMDELIRPADTVRVLTYTISEDGFRVIEERSSASNPAELVFSTHAVNIARENSRVARRFRSVIEASNRVYHYDGEYPHVIVIADGAVLYFVIDDFGNILGLFVTEDETIHSWAEETFDRYEREAERVGVDVFDADH